VAGKDGVKLTKRNVDLAEPNASAYFIWDTELKGYGARIDPTGAKTFIVRYRPKGQGPSAPKRFVTVGRYGTVTADEARNRARQILGAVATGHDPAAKIAAKEAAATFEDTVTCLSMSTFRLSVS
jgi:Arm DNA-binding domain